MDNQGCPYCSGHKSLKGFNTIGDKYPELIKYFKNPDDAFKYLPKSEQYVNAICPDCGYEQYRKVKDITRARGVACPNCKSFMSIPNRFLRNLIMLRKDILEKLVFEYSPDWLKGKLRYDVYFKYNGIKYIGEIDGCQHINGMWGKKKIKVLETDKIKEEKAKENNCVFVRIKAYESELEYLKKGFCDTVFQEIFKITDEEFVQIWENCQTNLFKQVIDMVNENPNMKIPDIAKKFGVSTVPIDSAIKRGNELGLCDYFFSKKNSKQVKVVNQKTKEEKFFYSYHNCALFFNLSDGSIYNYIKDSKEHYGYKFYLATKKEIKENFTNKK